MKKYTLPLFVLVSILALIGGCASTTSVQKKADIEALVLFSDADLNFHLDPALQEVDQMSDQQKLTQAEGLSASGKFEASNKILSRVKTQNLSNRRFIDATLMAAENYLVLFQIPLAANQLNQPRFKALVNRQSKEIKQRIYELQARVFVAKGDYYQALDNLISLSRMTKRKSHTRDIHDRIWTITSRMPYQKLVNTEVKEFVLSGWLELAANSRRYQAHPDEQDYILSQWRRNWKAHPAAKVPPSFFGGGNFWRSNPDQIALLLPMQEEYHTPSQALIQGFMSAYYKTMNLDSKKSLDLPEIRLYDTTKTSMIDAYNQAVDDGMEMVIGPLRQSEVEDLVAIGDLPVPTLTLNRRDNTPITDVGNLFQFGLSTADELTQIADRAWEKGHKNILMITPQNSWGKRSSEFFYRYWTDKGGYLSENLHYPPSVNDFTKILKKPLHIDLSEKRGLDIKRFINSSVNFTARRRQDIDLVVMLGYPLKARQIKPALDFLYASNIPVIATSHVYNGMQQVGLNRDLSGVVFSSMPWTLSGQLPQDLQPDNQLHTAYRQLFALGYDSFLIARNFSNLDESQSLPLFGSTGLLSLNEGIIKRQQKWAKFQHGKAIEIH